MIDAIDHIVLTSSNLENTLNFYCRVLGMQSKKEVIKEPQGSLISWSPWPPANFKTRYPAFPLVTTVLILIILRWLTLAN